MGRCYGSGYVAERAFRACTKSTLRVCAYGAVYAGLVPCNQHLGLGLTGKHLVKRADHRHEHYGLQCGRVSVVAGWSSRGPSPVQIKNTCVITAGEELQYTKHMFRPPANRLGNVPAHL